MTTPGYILFVSTAPVVCTPTDFPVLLASTTAVYSKCAFCRKAENAAAYQGKRIDDPAVFRLLCNQLTTDPRLFAGQSSQDLSLCFECTSLYKRLHEIHVILEEMKTNLQTVLNQIQSKVVNSVPLKNRRKSDPIKNNININTDGETYLVRLLRTEMLRLTEQNSAAYQGNKPSTVSSGFFSENSRPVHTSPAPVIRLVNPFSTTTSLPAFTGSPTTITSTGYVNEMENNVSEETNRVRNFNIIEQELKPDIGCNFELEDVVIYPEVMDVLSEHGDSGNDENLQSLLADPLELESDENCDIDKLCVTITVPDYLNRISGKANAQNSEESCWFLKDVKIRVDSVYPHTWKCTEDKCEYKTSETRLLQRHAHQMHKQLPKQYSCFVPYCREKFTMPFLRWTHAIDVHFRKLEYVCSKGRCGGLKFGDLNRYKKHIEQKHKENPIHKCHFCVSGFSHPIAVWKHMMEDHQSEFNHVCPICEKLFTDESYLIGHLAVHTPHGPYTCLFCKATSSKSEALEDHLMRSHYIFLPKPEEDCEDQQNDKPVPCTVCGKMFASALLLSKHSHVSRAAKNIKDRTCNICPNSCEFKSNDLLINHMLKEHESEEKRNFTCEKCSKCFTTNYMYARHIKLHSSKRPLSCTVCEKRYSEEHRNLFELHVKSHHTKVKVVTYKQELRHQCQFCSKMVPTLRTLRKHQLFHHPTEFKYECQFCEMKYPNEAFFKAHISTHNKEGLFICLICQTEFVSQQILQRHVKKHTGEEELVILCDKCDRTFTNKNSLIHHMTEEHGEEKTFCCNTCQRKFSVKHHLLNHMKTHTPSLKNAPRPFLCDICLKSFTLQHILTKHIHQVHERRFKSVCKHCGKVLSCRMSLKTHLARVHGEKITFRSLVIDKERFYNNVCYFCGQKFISYDHLNAHMKKHTGENPKNNISVRSLSKKINEVQTLTSSTTDVNPENSGAVTSIDEIQNFIDKL